MAYTAAPPPTGVMNPQTRAGVPIGHINNVQPVYMQVDVTAAPKNTDLLTPPKTTGVPL